VPLTLQALALLLGECRWVPEPGEHGHDLIGVGGRHWSDLLVDRCLHAPDEFVPVTGGQNAPRCLSYPAKVVKDELVSGIPRGAPHAPIILATPDVSNAERPRWC
jgi:hypothetical protein